MMTNAEGALRGSNTGMPQSFEDKSWQTCRRELAHLLDAQALDKVRTAYATAESAASTLADPEYSRNWRMRTSAAKLSAEFVNGALELLDKAFSKAERQGIADRLLTLESSLRTSEEINSREPHLG
jgi:hypothetical protein